MAAISQFDTRDSMEKANVGCASYDDAEAMIAAMKSDDYQVVANPRGLAHDIYRKYVAPARLRKNKLSLSAEQLGLITRSGTLDIATIFSESAKLGNSPEYGWWTPGLYLASGTVAETGVDLCPYASDGCRKNCLLVSGQREMLAHTALEVNTRLKEGLVLGAPTNLSLLRTYLRQYNPTVFKKMLYTAIEREQKYADDQGLLLAVRLNATSDIMWERTGIMEDFPETVFYDYTKIPQRVLAYLSSGAPDYFGRVGKARKVGKISNNPPFPDNYYLNFSYSEINLAWCLIMLRLGGNVVVPFDGSLGERKWEFNKDKNKEILPTHFLGRPVIDGDAYDPRFIDNNFWTKGSNKPPFIVGLRIKGKFQRKNKNAFFFDAHEAQSFGDNIDFIAEAMFHNTAEAIAQGKKNLLPPDAMAQQYLHKDVYRSFVEARDGK